MVEMEPKYDWRITLRKALIRMGTSAGLIGIGALVASLNAQVLPPAWVWAVPFAHALLAAANNWLKHLEPTGGYEP